MVFRARKWLAETVPGLSVFVRVAKVHEGVLFLECGNSSAAQECQELLSALQAFLQAECPFAKITAIRLLRGEDKA